MRADRILAIILIAISFVAAIGSWVMRPARSGGLELAGKAAGPLGAGSSDIAVFDMAGSITNGGDEGGGPPGQSKGITSARIVPLLRQAEKDKVKAILLRINSPGGTAAASQAIYEELMRIRKAGKIKIVAAFGDVGASGAYFIGAAAHHLMCQPATTTGSIGVIAHVPNFTGLMGKIGVQEVVFKSGAHKDILSPFRPVAPEERAIIQSLIDDTYLQFIEAVAAGRPKLPIAKLRPLADGRVYTGRQALKAGLVDSLGNWQDAQKKAAELAGIKGEPTTKVYTETSFLDYLVKLEGRLGGNIKVEVTSPLTLSFPARVPLALME